MRSRLQAATLMAFGVWQARCCSSAVRASIIASLVWRPEELTLSDYGRPAGRQYTSGLTCQSPCQGVRTVHRRYTDTGAPTRPSRPQDRAVHAACRCPGARSDARLPRDCAALSWGGSASRGVRALHDLCCWGWERRGRTAGPAPTSSSHHRRDAGPAPGIIGRSSAGGPESSLPRGPLFGRFRCRAHDSLKTCHGPQLLLYSCARTSYVLYVCPPEAAAAWSHIPPDLAIP